ncbi:protein obstructor-E-like [Eriocheir sinensis]|uniref:protein obstructor-E-like n=1 Tax=Eriocheir sinensis TaxID=95602 RepID=UPI0021C8BA70|nr:protein obstructor-E-like [Eriocheir sinensis]
MELSRIFRCSAQVPALLPCPALGETTTDTGRCDRYYKCEQGTLHLEQCPAGMLYNPARAPEAPPCDLPFDVEVSRLLQCSSQLPEQAMTHATEDRCDAFYKCAKGGCETKKCPAGLLYNPEHASEAEPCGDPRSLAESIRSECSQNRPGCILCPAEGATTTRHPAPGTYHRYLACLQGVPSYRQCPAGLMYSPDRADTTEPYVLPSSLKVSRFLDCSPKIQEANGE